MKRQAGRTIKTCYYKILGINVHAGREEIKSAFRYLAMKWHPDRNRGNPKAADRFREVLTAYEILINPATRVKYDRARGYRKQSTKPRYNWTDLHEQDGEADSFDEIFQDVFGIGRKRVRSLQGCDLRFDIQVPRSSISLGRHEQISYERLVFCRNCTGNGTSRTGCGICEGRGEHEQPCSLNVWIPAGIYDGTRIRVSGAGDSPYRSAPPGDLILMVHVIENC